MMRLTVTIAAVLMMTLGLFYLEAWSKKHPCSVSRLPLINARLSFQAILMLGCIVFLVMLWRWEPTHFALFFNVGNLSANVTDMPWLGVEHETWDVFGISLSMSISLATAVFLYRSFRSSFSLAALATYWPWVLLFSLTNSFAEEVIFRLGIVIPLFGHSPESLLIALSAVMFGLPHIRGVPNGWLGALMATLLGGLMCRAVIDTQGIFWAWLIHFLQDFLIFSALIMSAAHSINAAPSAHTHE